MSAAGGVLESSGEMFSESEFEDTLYLCGCCYENVPIDYMVQCLEGHLFCCYCLERYAQEAVFGQGEGDLKCLTEDCTAILPPGELLRGLPETLYRKYQERLFEESIHSAGLENFIRCRFCGFGAELEESQAFFTCLQCGKIFCRYCEVLHENHDGLTCEQVEKDGETQIRTTYEEKMAESKIRSCSKCKARFTKEDGCNLITCRCATTMCYVCRLPNIKYEHFCQHLREPQQDCDKCIACFLWSNAEEDDQRAILEIKKEARESRLKKGFIEEKAIGPLSQADRDNLKRAQLTVVKRKELHRYKKQRAPPIPNQPPAPDRMRALILARNLRAITKAMSLNAIKPNATILRSACAPTQSDNDPPPPLSLKNPVEHPLVRVFPRTEPLFRKNRCPSPESPPPEATTPNHIQSRNLHTPPVSDHAHKVPVTTPEMVTVLPKMLQNGRALLRSTSMLNRRRDEHFTEEPPLLARSTSTRKYKDSEPPLLARATPTRKYQDSERSLLARGTPTSKYQDSEPPLLAGATLTRKYQDTERPHLAGATPTRKYQYSEPPLLAGATPTSKYLDYEPPLLARATPTSKYQDSEPPLLARATPTSKYQDIKPYVLEKATPTSKYQEMQQPFPITEPSTRPKLRLNQPNVLPQQDVVPPLPRKTAPKLKTFNADMSSEPSTRPKIRPRLPPQPLRLETQSTNQMAQEHVAQPPPLPAMPPGRGKTSSVATSFLNRQIILQSCLEGLKTAPVKESEPPTFIRDTPMSRSFTRRDKTPPNSETRKPLFKRSISFSAPFTRNKKNIAPPVPKKPIIKNDVATTDPTFKHTHNLSHVLTGQGQFSPASNGNKTVY